VQSSVCADANIRVGTREKDLAGEVGEKMGGKMGEKRGREMQRQEGDRRF